MTPLPLTPEQCAIAEKLLRPGVVLLGRINREMFNGTNVETTGRLVLEIGSVPENAMENLRAAVRAANEPPKPARRRKQKASEE